MSSVILKSAVINIFLTFRSFFLSYFFPYFSLYYICAAILKHGLQDNKIKKKNNKDDGLKLFLIYCVNTYLLTLTMKVEYFLRKTLICKILQIFLYPLPFPYRAKSAKVVPNVLSMSL